MLVKLVTIVLMLAVTSAEHSGAYSSPQYAKKMYPKQGIDQNILLPKESPPVEFNNLDNASDRNDSVQYGRSSYLDSAGDFLSGIGGQIASNLAKDFIARSRGSSQVLSLNLTNLVILVVLKALILAAGFFGAGAWKGGHHYARSIDDNSNASYLSEDELALYLSFLSGQQSGEHGCLYRAACRRPRSAALYSSGAQLLLHAAKLVQGSSEEVDQYERVAEGIKEAAIWGEEGMTCDTRYKCGE